LDYLCRIMQKNISVILSPNKKTERLKKVLLGYNTQTYRNFELIITFDQADSEINSWLPDLKEDVFYTIKEIYSNVDENLQIENLLENIETDYIIFANSNSIPRFDFIEQHVKKREEGFYLVGSKSTISKEVFNKINKQDIYSGDCFELHWLKDNGNRNNFQDRLRYSKGLFGSILNFVFSDNLKFNSENASLWKKDMIYEKKYFNDDFFQDIMQALQKNNIKGKQIKYTTVLIS